MVNKFFLCGSFKFFYVKKFFAKNQIGTITNHYLIHKDYSLSYKTQALIGVM